MSSPHFSNPNTFTAELLTPEKFREFHGLNVSPIDRRRMPTVIPTVDAGIWIFFSGLSVLGR